MCKTERNAKWKVPSNVRLIVSVCSIIHKSRKCYGAEHSSNHGSFIVLLETTFRTDGRELREEQEAFSANLERYVEKFKKRMGKAFETYFNTLLHTLNFHLRYHLEKYIG